MKANNSSNFNLIIFNFKLCKLEQHSLIKSFQYARLNIYNSDYLFNLLFK